jgi:16S rRNA (guanine966-N2)-methyltransferase
LRVIGGEARGRRLVTLPGLTTRPTADRVRESIFGMIQPLLPDARVLDLFAGSGTLGLEAASRGARSVTFVEIRLPCCRAIHKNVERLELDVEFSVLRGDALRMVRKLSRSGRTYDIVLCDPPYQKGMARTTVSLVDTLPLLERGGVAVVEHHRRELLPAVSTRLRYEKQKRFGDTFVTLYCQREGSSACGKPSTQERSTH